jgi:hypothetical protein
MSFLCPPFLALVLAAVPPAPQPALSIDTPVSPPEWALLERALIRANTAACREFFARYFDDRGHLECVERWGGDDGPDDAIENLTDWPILHALGAPGVILELYKKGWEGHLRQYTAARTKDVEFARDGMYYKEFPVMFDWLHNGEGLTVFNLQGLSDPGNVKFQQRVRRYAGFYMNEDPGAPNYDPAHKIIRSLFNGSRGPLLRKATALDWAGDPIAIEGRFRLGHGENSYEQMLEHFKDYNDIIGDHPQNLRATVLATNAYMLTHEPKYRDWVIEYVDAWRERMAANGGIIPTNIGLDGTIGGACGGKWYGGVYGWGFTVWDPAAQKPVNRNTHALGLAGFGNALLLTGDMGYVDAWRRQIDAVNAHAKTADGRTLYPHMHGDDGWYDYTPDKYAQGALEMYYWSMQEPDRARLNGSRWIAFLDGTNANYPVNALRGDLALVRQKVEAMRRDTTTPDTRLSDDTLGYNPASVRSLIELMLGGLPPGNHGTVLHCRLRYFDPIARRAGVPEDVAALVEHMTADEVAVRLVNLNQTEPRTVTIQAGGYGEHQFTTLDWADTSKTIDRPFLTVQLAPGAGASLRLKMRRYANPPTLWAPWDRRS